MKRMLVIGMAVAALGLIAGTVSAQVQPRPVDGMFCETTRYDENGDGLLTKADFNIYLQRIIDSNCMDAENTTEACARFDTNGDGLVTYLDVRERVEYFTTCRRPFNVVLVPRPR